MCQLWIVIDWIYKHETLTAGILTAIILLAALIVTAKTLYAMRREHAMTIAMNLRRDYDSGMVFEGRKLAYKIDVYLTQRGINDKSFEFALTVERYKMEYTDEFAKLVSIPALFDMIGWLVRKQCCELTAIDEQIDWEQPYELWREYIRKTQNKSKEEPLDDNPIAMYGNFVWLAEELRKKKRIRCG